MALILLTVGMYGLLFEFMSPGAVLPGVMGAICLLLGLYGMQLLPINYSGLALICFGLACMVAEAFLPSFGVIGLGGVVAFVIGALLLMDGEAPGFGMPLGFVAGVGITAALLVCATAQVALRTRRRPAPGVTAGGWKERLPRCWATPCARAGPTSAVKPGAWSATRRCATASACAWWGAAGACCGSWLSMQRRAPARRRPINGAPQASARASRRLPCCSNWVSASASC